MEWLSDLLSGIADALAEPLWERLMSWLAEKLYGFLASLFSLLSTLGSDIFDFPAIRGFLSFFQRLGWVLFLLGLAFSVFDYAAGLRSGNRPLRVHLVSAMSGFLGSLLLTELPIRLYLFTLNLQNSFLKELGLGSIRQSALTGIERFKELQEELNFGIGIAFSFVMAYCVIMIFLASIKRSGILLIQIAVGSLYLFSLTRGQSDGFLRWSRQVLALCLTSFVQMSLFYLGVVTFAYSTFAGMGLLMAAKDVPRVAGQFGMDFGIRASMRDVTGQGMFSIHAMDEVVRKPKP